MSNQVYTITFNPTVDYVVECDGEIQKGINRLSETNFFVGGKGLNVSRTLKNFGCNSKAFGFVGGFTGEFVKSSFTRKGIAHDFVEINDFTRLNVKIKSTDIELNGDISKVTDKNFDDFISKISTVDEGNYLVLGGSAPQGCNHFFDKTLRHIENKNMKLILDINGKFLLDFLKYKPFLIKPNLKELCEIFDKEITEIDEVVKYAKELFEKGAENVLVSLGKRGGVLVCNEGVYIATQKDTEPVNVVGCGDAVVAGFLHGVILNENTVKRFERAMTFGVATAISIDLCSEKTYNEVLGYVTIEKVE
ncbi:MAG: 1-phosphofructokinase family hexose kinase [Lachnospirales bacterium]